MPSGACIDITMAQCRFTEIQKVIQVLFDDLDDDWYFHGLIIVKSDISETDQTLEPCHQFRINHTCLPQKPEYVTAAFGDAKPMAAHQDLTDIDTGLTRSQDIQNTDIQAVMVEREGGRVFIVLCADASQATLNDRRFIKKQIAHREALHEPLSGCQGR
jgi:hypothetical protein